MLHVSLCAWPHQFGQGSVRDKGFPLIWPLWKWVVNLCSFDSWSRAQALSEGLGTFLSTLLVGASLN